MSFDNANKKQKLSAKFWFCFGLSLLCVFVLGLGLVFTYKNSSQNFSGSGDGQVLNLTNQALVSNDGWNKDVLQKLEQASQKYGDNVALGNSNGVQGVVISLGGYNWQVVYRQNGVLTLFMVDSIDYQGNINNLNNYLNSDFYQKFLSNISYQDFDDYVVLSGDLRLAYQISGMQNLELYTVDGQLIVNNDIQSASKVWLPSAYEIGGYNVCDVASEKRVNSFNSNDLNGKQISTGLWNVSKKYRASKNALVRSELQDGSLLYLDENGILKSNELNSYSVRPAINIVVPQDFNFQSNSLSSNPKLAITGSGTSASPYVVSTASDLVTLSQNVLNGETYAGKYITLGADIDLSGVTVWNPIGLYNNGTNSKPFSGNFDGNGYKISQASSANTGLVGLFGYVDGATISNVAVTATNWATAGNYAGGLISVMANGSSLLTSYNNSSVSGRSFVGGLVGAINPASGNSCTISDVYNTGAVAGSASVAGIVGSASALSLARSYNIGTANSNKDIIDTAVSAITITNSYYTATDNQSYGTNVLNLESLRDTSTFTGFSFYSNSNASGVWFKSTIINDGFPTLKVFVKNVDVKLFTNINEAGDYYVTLQGSSSRLKTATAVLGTSATFTATANTGYRFLGWYVAVMSINGKPVINSEEATLFGTNLTFTQNLDDYIYLEARFVKTYVVGVSNLFSDFSTSYQNALATTVTHTGVAVGDVYDEGSVITISVSKNIAELAYVGLGYKTSGSATTYTSLGKDLDNTYSYWQSVSNNANDVEYVLVAGDGEAFSTGEFDIQVQFERKFNLTLSVTTDGTELFPSASVQFGNGGETLTASTVSRSATFEYNISGGLKLSVDLSNSIQNGAPLYSLDDWTFSYGSTDQTLGASTSTILIPTYIPSNTAANDSIYELTLVANFSLNTFEISLSAQFDGTRETADTGASSLASLYLKLGSGSDVSSISSNQTSLVVAQETIIGICFVPNYASGYSFKSLTVDGASVTPTLNSNGIYYYDFTMLPKTVLAVVNLEYTSLNVTPSVYLNTNGTYSQLTTGMTLSPASYANVNYYTNISALQLSVSTSNNLHMCYALSSVDVSFDQTNYTSVASYNNASAQQTYTFFNANTLVSFLYQQTSTTLTSTNTSSLLRIVLTPINMTLNMVAYYKGTTSVVDTSIYTLTLSSQNQISQDATTQSYSYVLGSSVTITTTSLNLGHKVLGYSSQTNATTGFSGTSQGGEYQNTVTFTFNIEQNTTLFVYFELRPFTIAFESNANTLTNGTDTLQTQGITARDVLTGSISLPFDTSSTTTSTITMLYGHTLAYSVSQQDITVNSKNLRLAQVVVRDATTNAVLNEYKTFTSEQTIQMIESGNVVYDSIKIVFTYNFRQTVRIKIDSSVTNTDRLVGASIQFNNQDIQGYNYGLKLTDDLIASIKTSANGHEMTLIADADGTDYIVLFLMDISYKVTYNDVSNSSTQFLIHLDGGNPIDFIIKTITFDNNAVNISGYFVFNS